MDGSWDTDDGSVRAGMMRPRDSSGVVQNSAGQGLGVATKRKKAKRSSPSWQCRPESTQGLLMSSFGLNRNGSRRCSRCEGGRSVLGG